jgi:hypothetical protein
LKKRASLGGVLAAAAFAAAVRWVPFPEEKLARLDRRRCWRTGTASRCA